MIRRIIERGENVKTKNVDYMDIAKAIGIIFVILGHTDFKYSNIIYLFHMPLFFFISGYFFENYYFINPMKVFVKKVRSLYFPYVKYCVIFLAFHNIFFYMNIYSNDSNHVGIVLANKYSISQFIKEILHILWFSSSEQLLGTFWFLYVLFGVEILFCSIGFLVKKLTNKYLEEIMGGITLVLFILAGILTNLKISLPKNLNLILISMFVFYIGYVYRKYEEKIKMNITTFVIFSILIIVCSSYSSVDMVSGYYSNFVLFIPVALLGIYLVIYISKLISIKFIDTKIKKYFIYVGKNTLTIMALHFLSFKIVNLAVVCIYSLPYYDIANFPVVRVTGAWWLCLIYCPVGVNAPLLISFITNKIKSHYKLIRAERVTTQ
ncbi:acyltransferase family protein [Clostridium estertheticum]|uniref:acyltransferase family protein n=1 Tax=Clostridium estertheticum TaxID=238834 RepID=UPI0013EE5043|nr:acyltransferase family protein [Clostridium estertheticum]MBZ9609303.1 acyltransferase family protein [Clostridium estertheticum]